MVELEAAAAARSLEAYNCTDAAAVHGCMAAEAICKEGSSSAAVLADQRIEAVVGCSQQRHHLSQRDHLAVLWPIAVPSDASDPWK